MFTKARYEAVRFNFQKSFRILTSSHHLLNLPSDPSTVTTPSSVPGGLLPAANPSLLAMYYNDVAITHFYQRKHNLSLFNLRKAYEENNKATKSGRKPDG